MYSLCGYGRASTGGSVNFDFNALKAATPTAIGSHQSNFVSIRRKSLNGRAILGKSQINHRSILNAPKNYFNFDLSIGKTKVLVESTFLEVADKQSGRLVWKKYSIFLRKNDI